MDRISFNPSKYRQKTKLAHTEWQDRASTVIKDLGIPEKQRSQVFRWFKIQRTKAEESYRYLLDHPKDNNFLYMSWLMSH